MNKEKFNNTELSILSFILLNSFTSSIIINLFKGYNTLEILTSLLISFIIGIPLLYLIARIYNNYTLNLNKYIIPVLIICSLIMGIYSLSYNSKIINEIIIPNHSIFLITLSLIIISTFLANKGLKSITIASNLIFIIMFFIFIITLLFNLNNVKPINLLPINTSINNLSFIEPLIYSISPILMILIIPKENILSLNKFKKNIKKVYILFYIYLITKILFILSILGIKYMSILNYPEIDTLKSINIFNFLKNIEEFLTINIFFENFILLSLVIFYSKTLLSRILNIKYNIYLISIILFLITINLKILDNKILLISNTIFIIINLLSYKNDKVKKNSNKSKNSLYCLL